jgi:hypothetical protein
LLGKDVLMGNHTSNFKIANHQLAVQVDVGDEFGLDGKRERGLPK